MSHLEQTIKLIRSRNGLPHWTDDEIRKEISRAVHENAMTYTISENCKVDGICFGKWITNEHFHIMYLTGKMRHFLDYLKNRFPQCKTLTGYRKGKLNLTKYQVSKFNIIIKN